MMAVCSKSFRYWDECVDPEDMEEMWSDPEVREEWDGVGEVKGQKVHLSRDPDGQPYLTQTELRAVVEIIARRHFQSQIDMDMICALSAIESDRQPLAQKYDKKTKEYRMGIMMLLPSNVEFLFRELGYKVYPIEDLTVLYRPFVNIYLGAAYLLWLSNHEGKERDEEYVIRAYAGGPKKATHKSTIQYWKNYLAVKENLPNKRNYQTIQTHDSIDVVANCDQGSVPHAVTRTGNAWMYWDSRASAEDMEELWRHPDVSKEWTASGERKGKVRLSQDSESRPYLSRVEVKAVADIIISRHFASRGVKSAFLSALAEISSLRFLHGVDSQSGIMGISYPTASWLYNDIGFRVYLVQAVEDLAMPFLSMYFGAAYVCWLSQYEGRERTPEFIVKAYLCGPENVNAQNAVPLWRRFEELLPYYEDAKNQGGCTIM